MPSAARSWRSSACARNGSADGRHATAWTWLQSGSFKVGLEILVDPLSTMMMLIVSGVGGLIVLYSIGYMDGDDEERRYFAYMSLFVFSMLLLVQGGNLLLLLVGWGLVGLSSYLLIGFWHERPTAVAAAKKAFVMNAFGDATMALAFFVLIAHAGSLSFADAFGVAPLVDPVDLVALGLLGGAAAKSAQIPLHTWLPDAMEGPTPVSALIHAATMVTAGVYLIARTHPIFEQARTVELVAAGHGRADAARRGAHRARAGRHQARDRVLDDVADRLHVPRRGIGAYANGMFHLMTHAFFKALLFMAAGIVIHALSGEQDIRNMRGIGQRMPWTRWAFLAGSLALVGIPPFAGFFSKDAIIAAALHAHWYGVIFWVVALIGTFLTGLYTFRLYFIVFASRGEPKNAPHLARRPRRAAGRCSFPSAILAVLAVVGGWIQFAPFWHPLTNWLDPVARNARRR